VKQVVLLTKDDCDFCEQAKAVLERVRGELELDVSEVRLESDEGRRLALASGVPFPPVVFLDGRPFSYGRLSERKLRKALA
jgi:glutaredoxin